MWLSITEVAAESGPSLFRIYPLYSNFHLHLVGKYDYPTMLFTFGYNLSCSIYELAVCYVTSDPNPHSLSYAIIL